MRSFGYAQDDKMGYAIVGRGLAPAEKRICPPSHSERSDSAVEESPTKEILRLRSG